MKKLINSIIFVLIIFYTLNIEDCMCQWVQLGPDGGAIDQVWSNSQYTFVAGYKTLYRSSNLGSSFNKINIPNVLWYNFQSLAGNGNYIICQPNTDNGLFRSSDNGNTWMASNNGLPLNGYARYLAFNNSIFYNIRSDSGLYKSVDNGASWIVVNSSIRFNYLGFIGSNLIGSGYRYQYLSGMIISTDGGNNWTMINNGLPQSFSSYYAIASNSNTVFIGVDSTGYGGVGIYKTTNNGQNWTASNNGLTNLSISSIYANGNTIYTTTRTGIFKSVDNGNNWTVTNNGIVPIRGSDIFGNGTNIIAGFGGEYYLGGFYYSTNNGNSWIQNNLGIYAQSVIDLTSKGNILFAAINGSGVWKSNDNGNSWSKTNNGLPFTDTSYIRFYGRSLGNDGQHVYCITSAIYKTSNDGISWSYANTGITSSVNCIGAYNNKVYAGTDQGLYVSSNAGTNWNYLGLSSRYIDGIDFSNSAIYACGSGVYQSTNNGVTWDTISGNITGGTEIKALGQYLYVVKYGSGVYKRGISGGSWVQINNGITNLGTEKIHVVGQYLMITTHGENNLFVSTNEGASWNNRNQGVYSWINSVTAIGGNVFVGTYGASVYRRPLSEIIGIQNISTEIPARFSLSQNYPNPFNPTTNIKFEFPKSSQIKLIIYDILGREVETLVNENLKEGSYQVDWNASQHPSGVYFYKLETEGFSDVKKMILLK